MKLNKDNPIAMLIATGIVWYFLTLPMQFLFDGEVQFWVWAFFQFLIAMHLIAKHQEKKEKEENK